MNATNTSRQPLGPRSVNAYNAQTPPQIPDSFGLVTIHHQIIPRQSPDNNPAAAGLVGETEGYSRRQLFSKVQHAVSMLSEGSLLPLHQRYLEMYIKACHRVLGIQKENIRSECEREIIIGKRRTWMRIVDTMSAIVKRRCPQELLTNPLSDRMLLMQKMLRLFRSRLFKRYGSFVIEIASNMNKLPEAREMLKWNAENELADWIKIAQQLSDEDDNLMQKYATGERFTREDAPTSVGIAMASRSLGLQWVEVEEAILEIGNTGELMPLRDLPDFIQDLDEEALKQALFNDLCDLPFLIDPKDRFALRIFRSVICALIDTLFVRNNIEPIAGERNTDLWDLSSQAIKFARSMKTKEPQKLMEGEVRTALIYNVKESMENVISLGGYGLVPFGFNDAEADRHDCARCQSFAHGKRRAINAWYGSELTDNLQIPPGT
ncbi:hypothetical protein PVAG01_00859 [Phlyctema vagabunda]|uniref:Uncharacterized protein n=1 Tax=Phlyctema vagabunda TaxID=108571 RepID=A0ABR4PVH3_9HELO